MIPYLALPAFIVALFALMVGLLWLHFGNPPFFPQISA